VPLFAQSLTTGDISGTVTDPTGAAIPNANVTLTSMDTGATQASTSNQSGEYRFTLLKPGRYTVAASETGFQRQELAVTLAVGTQTQMELLSTARGISPISLHLSWCGCKRYGRLR
jgi:Carboxypeptidase regulatory-like domain